MNRASIAAMNVFSENIASRQVVCRRVCNIAKGHSRQKDS